MSLPVRIRRASTPAALVLLWAVLSLPAIAQRSGPGPRSGARMSDQRQSEGGGHPGSNQEHLLQWMQNRSNLTPDQQQRALEHEPGFRDLPPDTQQRMRNRLTQLNNMPPERRQRLLERNEALARLSPPQRQQVRDALRQFSSLPQDRRHEVARAFQSLRQVPQSQRQAMLDSEPYRSQLSGQERGALSNLLEIEPYHVLPSRDRQMTPSFAPPSEPPR
jgi:hypothetical protein